MSKTKVVFLKLGTTSVFEPGWLEIASQQIHALRGLGYRVIVTSSGAVESGARRVSEVTGKSLAQVRTMYSKQTLAGFGLAPLLDDWEQALAPYLLLPVPLLLTHSNLATQSEAQSIKAQLLEVVRGDHGVIVANENDMVSGLEIHYWATGLGENDKLQLALITLAQSMPDIEVAGVLFATHRGGFYTADPSKDPNATLIPEVSFGTWPDTSLILRFLNPSLDPNEPPLKNNMVAKACAALVCAQMQHIKKVAIAKPAQLVALMTDDPAFVGTRFVP